MGDTLAFLVVDDSESVLHLHVAMLVARGHRCDFALNGCDAILKLSACDYDGVVTDNNMPGISGVDLVRASRGAYKPGELPFFIVTSDPREAVTDAVSGLPDVEVIAKPIDDAKIARILRVTRAARAARHASA